MCLFEIHDTSYIDGVNWTPYNYASGATTYYNNNSDGLGEPSKTANDLVANYKWYWDGVKWIEYLSKTENVGCLKPNSLDIYDMSGNIMEWCWDWFGAYPETAQINYRGPLSNASRVIRGGSWESASDGLSVGIRTGYGIEMGYGINKATGFRIAKNFN